MVRIHWTNFNYFTDGFASVEQAISKGKQACFDFSVYVDDAPVYSHRVIGGGQWLAA